MNEIVPIVSFPKSGNTWVRFIIANLFKKDPKMEVNFKNINSYTITKFHDASTLNMDILKKGSPIFVKQHANFYDVEKKDYKKALYIYRDGFDVIKSYKHFTDAQQPGLYKDMETFAKCYWNYCGHWGEHIYSWLEADKDIEVLPIRYEELKNQPIAEVKKIVAFLGHEFSENEIAEAIQASSKDKMKNLDGSKEFMKAKVDNFHFVRKAEVGDHDSLDIKIKKIFLADEQNVETMIKHGYLSSDSDLLQNRISLPFYNYFYCKFLNWKYRYTS